MDSQGAEGLQSLEGETNFSPCALDAQPDTRLQYQGGHYPLAAVRAQNRVTPLHILFSIADRTGEEL